MNYFEKEPYVYESESHKSGFFDSLMNFLTILKFQNRNNASCIAVTLKY